MTTQLERPILDRVVSREEQPGGRSSRLRDGWRRHRASWAYLGPLTVLAAVVSVLNLGGAPQRIDDEGTYTAQAWAVLHLGELTHYTYWYDHPPLGWLQIAGWTGLTGGFDRYSNAVLAGREAMVVAHLASVLLLWLLARRLDLGRPAAGLAVLVVALSPLSVQFSRTVYLDNVAVPWALAAFALALSRRHQLAAFAGSAACFGVAVLSKETFALLLPFLIWQIWRSAHPSSRRYTLAVAASLFVLIGLAYVGFALVKDEVLPGSGRVSLLTGIDFQLFGRQASGSVLQASTQAGRSVRVWLTLDAVLPVAAAVAVVVGLFVRRLRPYAALLGVLGLVILKPGYLPVPYVIAMVPFAALLVAGVLDVALRSRRWSLRVVAVVAGVAALAAAVPLWGVQLRGLVRADLDQPLTQAEQWMSSNLPRDQRLLVDDAVWVDLVRSGFPRQQVVWYYKADTDPAVERRSPNGWKDYDYILVTQALRRSAGTMPTVDTALRNSTLVSRFGTGEQQVSVYQVQPVGKRLATATAQRDAAARTVAARSLVENRRLSTSATARSSLTAGTVDSRVVTLLATLLADHRVRVSSFPTVDGEYGAARSVRITAVDGRPVSAAAGRDLVASARAQLAPYRPDRVELSDQRLTLTFLPTTPTELLPTPDSGS